MIDNRDFLVKKQKLEEAIVHAQNGNVKLMSKIQALETKLIPLKISKQMQSYTISETITSINTVKAKSEDLFKLIADNKWKLLKSEITLDAEQSNYGVYLKIMEEHKNLSLVNNATEIADEKTAHISLASCPESQSSTESVVALRYQLEAQAAEHSVNIVEYQENIFNEKQRHGILLKRNAAALLKLRKELQQSELNRKEVMEREKNNISEMRKY